MFSAVYVLWSLLPLGFFVLTGWAVIKKWRNMPGKEGPMYFLSQGIFCLIALGVAIYLDQTILESFVRTVLLGIVEPRFVSWLLYPAVLLVFAYLNSFIKPKNKKPAKRVASGPQFVR